MQIEGEQENTEQIEHTMATAVSEIEAIDPQSLEEAMRRPDWKKMGSCHSGRTGSSKKGWYMGYCQTT